MYLEYHKLIRIAASFKYFRTSSVEFFRDLFVPAERSTKVQFRANGVKPIRVLRAIVYSRAERECLQTVREYRSAIRLESYRIAAKVSRDAHKWLFWICTFCCTFRKLRHHEHPTTADLFCTTVI